MDIKKILILYFINLIIGILFGNIWYCLGINVLFAFLYIFHKDTSKKINDDKSNFKSSKNNTIIKPKPIKERKTKPSPDDNVFYGVEISKEEYEKKLKEETGWYSKMTDQLNKEIDKLHNFFDKNGNK